jgi:tRNA A58 N-methylase Trm61
MSFGISAIHLASAVRDNGSGRVVTTELSATKIATAKRTFAETGLNDLITVLEGDALSTLADLDGPVAFVPLEPYLDHVRNTENGYVNVNFLAGESGSMEISCRI